jgi:hypothetical protein
MGAADDPIGFLASALVLATFAMRDMRRLRATAVLSNVTFIAYGALHGLLPVLALHILLLPLNIRRLIDEARTAPRVAPPSKATLLAIEALHHAEAARAQRNCPKRLPANAFGIEEARTRILAQAQPQATWEAHG